MELSVPWHSRILESQSQGQRTVTPIATLKVSTPFLIVCWLIAVWWWTNSLSVVLLSPEEATCAEEEKRSVETFYDCIDLDLEANTFNGNKVREISNDPQ